VNPVDFLLVAVVLFFGFCVAFFAGFLSAIAKHLLGTGSAQRTTAATGQACPRDQAKASTGGRSWSRFSDEACLHGIIVVDPSLVEASAAVPAC
jgi:hypothetical protein